MLFLYQKDIKKELKEKVARTCNKLQRPLHNLRIGIVVYILKKTLRAFLTSVEVK
jgi:hypothetical protein